MNLIQKSVFTALFASALPAHALDSPDHRISVKVVLDARQALTYSVQRNRQAVILPSELGLQLAGANLATGLTLETISPVKAVLESYEMAVGKRRHISYRANEQVFSVHDAAGHKMDVAFRVSNDGMALRYVVKGEGRKQFVSEATSFAFAPSAKAWLQPMQVAQTGWKNTNPAY